MLPDLGLWRVILAETRQRFCIQKKKNKQLWLFERCVICALRHCIFHKISADCRLKSINAPINNRNVYVHPFYLVEKAFFNIWCDENNSFAAGQGKFNKSTSMWKQQLRFLFILTWNRKTRKGRKTTKRFLGLLFQHGCFSAKNLYWADWEQGGGFLQDQLGEWLELCVIIGFSSRTTFVNLTWTSLLKAHAVYLYTVVML